MEGGQTKFYAVRAGHVPGIYETWEEAEPQVRGYKFAKHKSFSVYEDALHYMRTGEVIGLNAGVTTMGSGSRSDGGRVIAEALRAWSLAKGGVPQETVWETPLLHVNAIIQGLGRLRVQGMKVVGRSDVQGNTTGGGNSALDKGKSNVEEVLGFLCGKLEVGEAMFVPQAVKNGDSVGQHAFTVILPNSAPVFMLWRMGRRLEMRARQGEKQLPSC
ncbi:hypothetical protein PIB30_024257 [Stylosanthes scabra]|uniref:Ribonuclease H1 N-terminal domain-containing protein n=1 Tax=Stylosanthes scabra TaxID=79078 RepID=A0ABU6U9N7_9FABA|nr:hypothetical protein [Stylosanthes scabra]